MLDAFRIVNFHGIGTPKRQLEEGEENYWISEEKYVQFLNQIAPFMDRVAVTFDDGNQSDLEIGARELAERQMTATFFPLAGRLDDKGSLAPADLRQLINLGHRIGSHGYEHVSWKNLDHEGVQRELIDARKILENCIGGKITEAAIPFGDYGRTTLQQLKSQGYLKVYSSDGGCYRGNPFPVPRWSVRADTNQSDLEDFLSGRESLARRGRRFLSKLKKQGF